MAINYRVVEDGKIKDVRTIGVWREPNTHQLVMFADTRTYHPDFSSTGMLLEGSDKYVVVHPDDHVVWVQ